MTYSFDEVAEITSGQIRPSDKRYSHLPLVGSENLPASGGELVGEIKSIKDAGVISGKYLFQPRQVVYSKIRPNLNKIWYASFSGACSADIYPISFNEDVVLSKYGYHYMLSARFRQPAIAASMRSGIPKVNRDDLSGIEFVVPSIEEQDRIVRILDIWDEAIRLAQRRLDTAVLLHGRRIDVLLSDKGARLSSWRASSLSDMGHIATGGTPSVGKSDYWGGDIPWITPGEVTQLVERRVSKTERKITKSGLKNSSADVLPAGSLIVCTRATIGSACINEVPMAINQGFKAIVPKVDVDVDFLYYALGTLTPELKRLASGSTFMEIGKNDFASIEIRAPDYFEQKRIAKALSASDEGVVQMARYIEALKKQKLSLMQRLIN